MKPPPRRPGRRPLRADVAAERRRRTHEEADLLKDMADLLTVLRQVIAHIARRAAR